MTLAAALEEALRPLVKDGPGLRIASEFVARVPEAADLSRG